MKILNSLIILLFLSCFTKFTFSSVIRIEGPKELKEQFSNNNGDIPASFATFGKIGKVYYDPDNPDVDMACKPITTIDIDNEHDSDNIPIIMVDRGNCTFVTKVRMVQKMGGMAALIVNNKEDHLGLPIMSDDGTGDDIYIPAMLIKKSDGEKIKNFYKNNKNNKEMLSKLFISIDNRFKTLKDKVKLKMFFLPNDQNIFNFIEEFSKNEDLIESSSLDFEPIYPTHNYAYDDKGYLTNYMTSCYCNGKYCTQNIGVVKGEDILNESLRQKCIYKLAYDSSNDNKYSKIDYWNYLRTFYNFCIYAKAAYDVPCAENMISMYTNIPVNKVNECIMNSFVPAINDVKNEESMKTCTKNSIFEDEKEKGERWIPYNLPVIYLDNEIVYGTLTAKNVLQAICADLKDKPVDCNKINFDAPKKTSSSFKFINIFWIILALIGVNLVIYYFCRRYAQKRLEERLSSNEINDRINSVVTNYLALKDRN